RSSIKQVKFFQKPSPAKEDVKASGSQPSRLSCRLVDAARRLYADLVHDFSSEQWALTHPQKNGAIPGSWTFRSTPLRTGAIEISRSLAPRSGRGLKLLVGERDLVAVDRFDLQRHDITLL